MKIRTLQAINTEQFWLYIIFFVIYGCDVTWLLSVS